MHFALISNAILAIAFPPLSWWVLAWPAGLIFIWGLYKNYQLWRLRDFFFYFFIYGLSANILGFYWLAYTFHEFASLSWAAAIIVMLLAFSGLSLAGGFLGMAFFLVRRLPRQFHWLALFLGICLWEHLDTRFFPWSPFLAFGEQKYLLASVNLLGTWGWRVVFYLATFCSVILVGEAKSLFNRKLWLKTLTVYLLTMSFLFAVGFFSLNRFEKEFSLRQPVALVQGNVGNFEKKQVKLGRVPSINDVIEIHRTLIEKTAIFFADIAQAPDGVEPWVAWPETSFPGDPFGNSFTKQMFRRQLLDWTRLTRGLHLIGSYELADYSWGGQTKMRDYNVIGLFHESAGMLGHYRKIIRIPFGEFIPGEDLWPGAYKYLPAVNHFGKGLEYTLLPHPDSEGPVFIPLICYEILFAGFIDQFIEEAAVKFPGRPLVIANASNDSWYGPTSEKWQHSLLARWQISRVGIPTLRTTNTGLSQIIAPWGEVLATGPRDIDTVVFGQLPVKKLQKRLPILDKTDQ